MSERTTQEVSVAWVLGRFPSTAETFILRQITGLIDRGVRVDLFAREYDPDEPVHEAVMRYGLRDRVCYPPRFSDHPLLRAANAVRMASSRGLTGWRLLGRALSRRRFGSRARSLRPFFEAWSWLDKPEYDVIIASYGTIGAALTEFMDLGLCRGRLITFFRGYDATRVPRQTPSCYTKLFAHGDLFLAVSEDLRQSLIELGCPSDRLQVARGGVELEDGAVAPPSRAEGEPTRLLSVCRLVEKKGLAMAVDAVARVVERGRLVRYDIVGDGPLRDALGQQIERLNLQPVVHLCGWRDQTAVREMLRASHLVLAPSVTPVDGNREGVPNVIKEAMACRRPVVATRHGGIPEAIEDTVTGRLVNEYDVDGFASALLELIDSPERWPAMGEAGRRKAEAMFDAEKLNDELAALVRRIVHDEPRRPFTGTR